MKKHKKCLGEGMGTVMAKEIGATISGNHEAKEIQIQAGIARKL